MHVGLGHPEHLHQHLVPRLVQVDVAGQEGGESEVADARHVAPGPGAVNHPETMKSQSASSINIVVIQ